MFSLRPTSEKNCWPFQGARRRDYILAYLRRHSPKALTTSLAEALQARRPCASSLDTFTQSFLYRAWPKTRGPWIDSRSALIVVAHA